MKNILKKIFYKKKNLEGVATSKVLTVSENATINLPLFQTISKKEDLKRNKKLEAGAKDFAVRFEGVMRELSNG